MIHLVMLEAVDVVLVLGPLTSTYKKLISLQTGMMGGVWSYQYHRTSPPIESLFSKDYPVNYSDGSSFGVAYGDGKGGVGTITNHL